MPANVGRVFWTMTPLWSRQGYTQLTTPNVALLATLKRTTEDPSILLPAGELAKRGMHNIPTATNALSTGTRWQDWNRIIAGIRTMNWQPGAIPPILMCGGKFVMYRSANQLEGEGTKPAVLPNSVG